jgi:hypothetical protein
MREKLSTIFAIMIGVISVALALLFAAVQSGLV